MKKIVALFLALSAFVTAVRAEDVLVLTPESLRVTLLASNQSILSQMQLLYQAKDQVNLARAQLLPSLNLGLTLTASGPSFIISSAASLLPFLLPSNWFRLRQSKHLFEAEKVAFYLMELNQYASAYSLYATFVADQQLRQVALTEYQNLKNIHDILQNQYDLLGNVSFHDIAQARAQSAQALYNVQKLDELLARETAAMRLALALPLSTRIQVVPTRVAHSSSEAADLAQLVAQAEAQAPEKLQLDYLVAAAKDAKWAEVFSFLTGATLSARSQGADHPISFSSISATGTVGIGPAMFPAVALSNDRIQQLQLRQQEIHQELTQVLETTMMSLVSAQQQLLSAHEAERGFADVYHYELQLYWLGLTDLLHVLHAENAMTAAAISRISSELDVDNLRIALHRVLLSDQFAHIPTCQLAQPPKRDSWFGSKPHLSVDQLCGRLPLK